MGVRTLYYKIYTKLAGEDKPILVRRNNINYKLPFNDCIGARIIKDGVWEKKQIEFLTNLCKKNNIRYFFDIGSYFGYYSVWLGKNINLTSAWAFEANPDSHKKLVEHVKINNLDSTIKTLNIGLSENNTKAKFLVMDKTNPGSSRILETNGNTRSHAIQKSTNINLQRFDDLAPAVDGAIAMKIDVEGHELSVLKGAENFLQNHKVILQIEIFENNKDAVFKWLISHGFECFRSINSDYYFKNSEELNA